MKPNLKLLPIAINCSRIPLPGVIPRLVPSGGQSHPWNCRTCHEISNPALAVSDTLARITVVTDHGFRGLFILLSIRPQLVLSRPSPYFAYERATFGSICEGCEPDELRLREPGDDGAEDPGVSADAAVGFAVALAAAAAAAGLQCAQTKMLKPRPLQLRQIAPLGIGLVLGDIRVILGAGVYIPRGIPCATFACNHCPPSDAWYMLGVKVQQGLSGTGHCMDVQGIKREKKEGKGCRCGEWSMI